MLCLLIVSTLTLAPQIQIIRADNQTITINADGSINGSTSIQTADNITYLFLGDINGSIVVGRDFIVLDGAGHTLQGTGTGISLSQRTNVTIQKMQITAFDNGLWVNNCANCTISGNRIVKNHHGIIFYADSSNIDVAGNNITQNDYDAVRTDGFTDGYDSNKPFRVYHNNFVDNGNPRSTILGWAGAILWDLGYPSGGNYWSGYDGTDSKSGPYQNESGSDGIGDSPYIFQIPGRMGSYDTLLVDNYPLTIPFGSNLPFAFPTADFTYAPHEPLVNQTVVFNASTSTCINGTITRFKWDFGDGKKDTGPTVSHIYETQGNYNVTLTIISNTLIPDTKHQSIYVGLVPAWQPWVVIGALTLTIVAIGLVLSVRRSRLKKSEKQKTLLEYP